MSDTSTSVSHVLYMLAFDCPLPPILASVPAMCRFAAVTLAVPFVFCVLLDLVAYCAYHSISLCRSGLELNYRHHYCVLLSKLASCRSVIARTLHLSPRDIRLPRSPPTERSRSKTRFRNSKSEAVLASIPGDHTQPLDATPFQSDATRIDHSDDTPAESPSINYSPASVATSIASSSSVSIASSESTDDSDTTHTPNAGLRSRDSNSNLTNSLGLSGYDEHAAAQGYSSEAFSRVIRRKAFAHQDEEDADGSVSRENTPRGHALAPSLRSVDEQGFLVPSSLGSSTTTSPAPEVEDPVGQDAASIDGRDGSIPAPREVTEKDLKDDAPEIEGMASVGTLMLGAPIQT